MSFLTYHGKLLLVVDGETAVVRLKFAPFGVNLDARITLANYVAPETIGPEADLGRQARAALNELLARGELDILLDDERNEARSSYPASVVVNTQDGPVDVVTELISKGWGREGNPTQARAPFERERYPAAPAV